VTACLEGGRLLEKAAASVSVVTGELSAGRAAALAARGAAPVPAGTPYAAAALSIVFHPASPHVPTLRGDVRLFYAATAGGAGLAGGVSAFGGGTDLTPSYLYPPDAVAFHTYWKGVCDRHAPGLYGQLKVRCLSLCLHQRGTNERERFPVSLPNPHHPLVFFFFFFPPGPVLAPHSPSLHKTPPPPPPHSPPSPTHRPPLTQPACDAYFYLPARREHRGLGGIFYDDVAAVAAGLAPPAAAATAAAAAIDGAAFSADVVRGWIPSWTPAVEARRGLVVTPAQRAWQLGRRGRYVEFNLLYDRGVRFGLDAGGGGSGGGGGAGTGAGAGPPPRVDAVMVSAPPLVAWAYVPEGADGQPVAGSPEADVVAVLRAPREWAV